MATYVNNLRLTELATGEGSGTWGTTTNTSLELIGEALGYNTQNCFSSDADATTTIADGATDPARAFYFKVTSSATLTATRTLTIAPNTISRVMFIENATTGSQSITISQGSGANVTIATGKTAVVYLDGAGSGAAVVDAMANVDPGVTDTLAEVLVAGNATGGTDIAVGTGDDITFADSSKAIFGAGSDLQIYHDGTNSYITNATNDLLLDLAGDIIIDADGGDFVFRDGGNNEMTIKVNDGSNVDFISQNSDHDMRFRGNDGGSTITALTLNMSEAGEATFNSDILLGDSKIARFGADQDFRISFDGSTAILQNVTSDSDITFKGSDAGSSIDALRLDMSNEGRAFFNAGASFNANVNLTDNDAVIFGDSDDFKIYHNSVNNVIQSVKSDADLYFVGKDGGSDVNALILDMSEAGAATFNSDIYVPTKIIHTGDTDTYLEFSAADTWRVVAGNEERFKTASGEVTVNESSQDTDFRVESDNQANMLVVDASADKVGIGGSAGDTTLTVRGSNNSAGDLYTAVGAGNVPGIVVQNAGTTDNNNAAVFFKNDAAVVASIGARFNSHSTEETELRLSTTNSSGTTRERVFIQGDGDFGIGAQPSYKLDVQDSATLSARLHATGNNTRATGLYQAHTSGGDDVNMSIGVFGDANRGELSTATNHTLRLYVNNTPSKYLEIATTGQIFTSHGLIVNEDSNDSDFRVESNANSTFLFLDAGSERLHINGATGTSTFNVAGSSSFASTASSGALSASGATLSIQGSGSYNSNYFGTDRATVAIRSNEPSNDGWNPTLNIATIRQSLVSNQNATGGIGFTTIDDSNNTGIDDAGRIEIANTNGASNTSATRLVFYNNVGGSKTQAAQQVMSLDPYETILNEDSLSRDFRVESDSQTHMLFVDASANKIGINQSNPAAMLDILTVSTAGADAIRLRQPSSSDTFQIQCGISAVTNDGLFLRNTNSTGQLQGWKNFEINFNDDSVDRDFRVESNNNANMLFVDAGNDVVVIGSTVAETADTFEVISSDTNTTVRVRNTNAGADGPILVFDKASASPANDDNVGDIRFIGKDSAGNAEQFARILAESSNVTSGAEDAAVSLEMMVNGSNAQMYNHSHVGTVFNELSNSVLDFRVESDANTHALFVDAGSEAVGLFTSSPNAPLHVQTNHSQTNVTLANTNSTLNLGNTAAGDGIFNAIKFSGNQQDMYIMSFNDSTQRDRRLGFFVGSVAGDSTSDQHLSITGSGAIVTSADNAVSKVTLTGLKSGISDNVATSFAKIIANTNEVHGHLVLKYNLEQLGVNIGVGQFTFRVFYNGGTTLLDQISSDTTVFTPTITATASGNEFTLKVQMDTSTSTFDFDYSLEFLSHNTNVAVANMEEV